MKVFAVILICLICVAGLVFVAYFVGVTSDDRRLDIARETALIRAESERDATRADGQVKVINAQTRLENAKLSSDPQIRQAMRTRAYLSAWFPVYFPIFFFAGMATLTAVYYTFRLTDYQDDTIKTKVRVFDSAKLVDKSLQVKAIEAAQGVDVLQLAEQIQQRNMSSLGTLARGLRGMMGRENITVNQAALPAIESAASISPTFQQARQDFRENDILIGYADGKPIYLPIESFVSCAFGGGSGSGKTSKLRFLVAQLILNGVNVYILDAHQGNAQSLVDSLGSLINRSNVTVFPAVETRESVNKMLASVQAAITAGKPDDVASVYVLEELRPLNRACDQVEILMDKVANEGRKFRQFGVFSSQTWEAKQFGKSGSAARDACVLKMAAKMPKEQARTLFKDGESARTVARLARPEMYADSMSFNGVVTVPFCSREDCDSLTSREKVYQKETQQADPETVDSLTDMQLIGRVNLKKGMMGNNEFARLLELDEGLTSKSLRGLVLPLFPAVRTAFKNFLQSV